MPLGLAFASSTTSSTPRRASSKPPYIALRTLSIPDSTAANLRCAAPSPSFRTPSKEKGRSITGRRSPYLPLRSRSPSSSLSIVASADYLHPDQWEDEPLARTPSPVQLCFGAPGSPGHLSPVLQPEVSLIEACGSTRRPVSPGVYIVKGDAGMQHRYWMVGDKMARVTAKGQTIVSVHKSSGRKFHHGRSESII